MTRFKIRTGVECIQCNNTMLITEVMDVQVLTCPARECGMFGKFFQLPTIDLKPWPEPVDGFKEQ